MRKTRLARELNKILKGCKGLTYKSINTFTACVENINGIDAYFTQTSKAFVWQCMPKTRIGTVYIHCNGISIGANNPLDIVLLKSFSKITNRKGSILKEYKKKENGRRCIRIGYGYVCAWRAVTCSIQEPLLEKV